MSLLNGGWGSLSFDWKSFMLQIKLRGFVGETKVVVRDSSGCLWAGSGPQATSV